MASKSDLVVQGRKAIDTVAQRVKTDPDYAARFKREPVEVLLEAGAPQESMTDILRETGFEEEEVSGFLFKISPDVGKLPGTKLGTPGSPARLPGGGLPGGGFEECTATCHCSTSCLITF